jgi:hypothetical protein
MCFTLNGISYVAVIISLIVIKVGFVAPKTQTSVLKSMTEGSDSLETAKSWHHSLHLRFAQHYLVFH